MGSHNNLSSTITKFNDQQDANALGRQSINQRASEYRETQRLNKLKQQFQRYNEKITPLKTKISGLNYKELKLLSDLIKQASANPAMLDQKAKRSFMSRFRFTTNTDKKDVLKRIVLTNNDRPTEEHLKDWSEAVTQQILAISNRRPTWERKLEPIPENERISAPAVVSEEEFKSKIKGLTVAELNKLKTLIQERYRKTRQRKSTLVTKLLLGTNETFDGLCGKRLIIDNLLRDKAIQKRRAARQKVRETKPLSAQLLAGLSTVQQKGKGLGTSLYKKWHQKPQRTQRRS